MLKRKLPPWLALLVLFVCAPQHQAAAEESLPELVRRVKPAVVSVITYNEKGEVAVTGSGFFVRPGQVLTNFHVVEAAARAEIRTFEGKGKTYAVAGILDVDEEGDLALLGVEVPAERARVSETTTVMPEEGERVFVIGNPLRLEGSVGEGFNGRNPTARPRAKTRGVRPLCRDSRRCQPLYVETVSGAVL